MKAYEYWDNFCIRIDLDGTELCFGETVEHNQGTSTLHKVVRHVTFQGNIRLTSAEEAETLAAQLLQAAKEFREKEVKFDPFGNKELK